MNSIRRYRLSIALVLASVFAIPMVMSVACDFANDNRTNFIIDFEENSDTSENQKKESKVKEFKLTYLNAISLRRQYLNDCQAYGQLGIQHSLDVFLDILTPPPEA